MISVKIHGIEAVIKNITGYYGDLEATLKEICYRLAVMGCDIARAAYIQGAIASRQYEETEVEVVPTDSGAMIVASGQSVFFLEFGAGVFASSNEMNTEGLDTSPGSWSKDHLKMFSEHGFWVHKGDFYEGILPFPGMNMAREEVLKNIETVAKEVLGK